MIDIRFDENQSVPKYRQIIDAVADRIKKGELDRYKRIVLSIKNQRTTLQEIASGFKDSCLRKSVSHVITTDIIAEQVQAQGN